MRSPARPEFEPSETVHIAPWDPDTTANSSWGAPNYWIRQGWSLAQLGAQLWELHAERIEIDDPELAAQLFDVALVLPHAESDSSMHRRVRREIGPRLGLEFRVEDRVVDVYVLTLMSELGEGLRPSASRGIMSASSQAYFIVPSGDFTASDIDARSHKPSIGGDLHLSGADLSAIAGELERFADRPVVAEAYLPGVYDLRLRWRGGFQALSEQIEKELGLALRPGRRALTFLRIGRAS
jgi:uncharacterized protein (TIGR03435 family)